MAFARRIGNGLERTIYVVAGLPIAIRGASLAPTDHARTIRRAFAQRYWRPTSISDAAALVAGLLAAPVAVPLAALWFTLRNGLLVRSREGKGLAVQFIDQLRLYGHAGIVGPWYYILSLHRDGMRRAPTFLQRCETKRGIYSLLKDGSPTTIGNKRHFATHCARAGIPCASCEMVIEGEFETMRLPDCDLFVKPLTGCGGRGAERWDRVATRLWSNGTQRAGELELLNALRSRGRPLVVQRLLQPHSTLEPLTSGALPTVRALTILDERGMPELVAASFRMSMGDNRTVDNIHAGGLACAVSLKDGRLGVASDLGASARLGWVLSHPNTGARIEGVHLPFWDEVRSLAVRAHRTLTGRLAIGWDIAICDDGPLVIEANRGPDMDLMQRFMDTGFCGRHRFGELIAHHLRERGYGLEPVSAPDASRRRGARGASGTSAR